MNGRRALSYVHIKLSTCRIFFDKPYSSILQDFAISSSYVSEPSICFVLENQPKFFQSWSIGSEWMRGLWLKFFLSGKMWVLIFEVVWWIHTWVGIHTYTYIHFVCMYVYVYIYIYMWATYWSETVCLKLL